MDDQCHCFRLYILAAQEFNDLMQAMPYEDRVKWQHTILAQKKKAEQAAAAAAGTPIIACLRLRSAYSMVAAGETVCHYIMHRMCLQAAKALHSTWAHVYIPGSHDQIWLLACLGNRLLSPAHSCFAMSDSCLCSACSRCRTNAHAQAARIQALELPSCMMSHTVATSVVLALGTQVSGRQRAPV